MKNVLVIASLYGSKRVIGLAKYLPSFGWQPTIITPPASWQPTIITDLSDKKPVFPFRVIETEYKDWGEPIRKMFKVNTIEEAKSRVRTTLGVASNRSCVDELFRLGGTVLNYPDSYNGWHRFALKAGTELLEHDGIEAIVSICPVTSHIVAGELKRRYRIPWLADFPDLWSQNFNYSYGKLRRLIDRRLEKRTMSNVNIITTSSASCADRLGALHEDKPTYSVTLGYDPQEYDTEPPAALTPKFTVTYTGLIYEGKQNPRKLLVALSDLLGSGQIDRTDCDIRFYGRLLPWLDRDITELHLSDVVSQYATIPHSTIVDIQRRSQVLLLLDWDDPNELGAYTAKIFEYLGARRPILSVGGVYGNAVDEMMRETRAGICAPTVENVKDALLEYYREYKLNGCVPYSGIDSEIRKHSQFVMAGRFAELLQGISDR